MAELKIILKQEVKKYAGSGRGANLLLFPLLDDEHQTYGVVAVNYPQHHYTLKSSLWQELSLIKL
jgi:hypothetical protein